MSSCCGALGAELTVHTARQRMLGLRCGFQPCTDDSELGAGFQSRTLDIPASPSFVFRKFKLLDFVTFTVATGPPRFAPTLLRVPALFLNPGMISGNRPPSPYFYDEISMTKFL
jgi:hypothetical protein